MTITGRPVTLTNVAADAAIASAVELIAGSTDPLHGRSRLLSAAARLNRAVAAGQLDRSVALDVLIDAAEKVGLRRNVAYEIACTGLSRRPPGAH